MRWRRWAEPADGMSLRHRAKVSIGGRAIREEGADIVAFELAKLRMVAVPDAGGSAFCRRQLEKLMARSAHDALVPTPSTSPAAHTNQSFNPAATRALHATGLALARRISSCPPRKIFGSVVRTQFRSGAPGPHAHVDLTQSPARGGRSASDQCGSLPGPADIRGHSCRRHERPRT